jgi:hypothetical protein
MTAGRDSQERTARKGWPEQDSQNKTARTGQPERDNQNETARREQPKSPARIGLPSQDCLWWTARKVYC